MISTMTDRLDPARARALQVTLGRRPTIAEGDPLPPFFHQVYFWDPHPPARLGRDGHPAPGVVLPETGLPRRMWAGGAIGFHHPLRAGIVAERRSAASDPVRKEGRSGPLAFVTVRHEVWQEDRLCLTERQDIVYREDPAPGAPPPAPPAPPEGEDSAETRVFSEVTLFRYSALTLNGHRIHYDRDYATGVEGHAGVVVHGPLLAQCLMLMVPEAAGVAYQLKSPAIAGEPVRFCRRGADLWARAGDRLLCAAQAG